MFAFEVVADFGFVRSMDLDAERGGREKLEIYIVRADEHVINMVAVVLHRGNVVRWHSSHGTILRSSESYPWIDSFAFVQWVVELKCSDMNLFSYCFECCLSLLRSGKF
jgi:hypothetical protein